jgi:hypothetical protein
MQLKKYILLELRKANLDESVFALSGFTDAIQSDFSTFRQGKTKQALIDSEETAIKSIVQLFDGGFKDYLEKDLRKKVRREKISILAIISKYLDSPNNSTYKNNILSLIGTPMLNYFLQKAFGKDSIWSRIRQITPFMKKVSTGNYALDTSIYTGLATALESGAVMNEFTAIAEPDILPKVYTIASDGDFNNLFLSEVLGINRGLRSVGRSIGASLQNTGDAFKDLFVKREVRDKFKLVKEIMKYLPSLKKPLRGKIKDEFFGMEHAKIAAFFSGRGVNVYSNIKDISVPITRVVLKHLMENAKDLYFEDLPSDISDIVYDLFTSQVVAQNVSEAVINMMRDAHEKLKYEEDKRKQYQTKSRYNR